MNHTSFAALPAAERRALMDILRRCGIVPGRVCVSRLELPAAGAGDLPTWITTVTTSGWCRSYDDGAGWMARLERDLGGVPRPARA